METSIVIALWISFCGLLGLYINSRNNNKALCSDLKLAEENYENLNKERLRTEGTLWGIINSKHNDIKPLNNKIKSLQNRLMNKSEEIQRLKDEINATTRSYNRSLEERLFALNELNASKERIKELENMNETQADRINYLLEVKNKGLSVKKKIEDDIPDFPVK